MCSHGFFYRGNEKQTHTNLKNINVVLLRMSHSLKVPYTSLISYRVLNLVFSRGRGEERSANSKQGAYLMLGAKNPDPLRSGDSHITGRGMREGQLELNAYSKFQALGGALNRSGALI